MKSETRFYLKYDASAEKIEILFLKETEKKYMQLIYQLEKLFQYFKGK